MHRFTLHTSHFILITFILSTLLTGCRSEHQLSAGEHQAEIEQWHRDRIDRLKEPQGWLRLAGLYWFDEPVQTFGTAGDVDFLFPEGSVPAYAGRFELQSDTIRMYPADGLHILADGQPLDNAVIYTPTYSAELQYGRLTWMVIQRGDLTGIRLFDTESEILKRFRGIERYPPDLEYRVMAKLVPHDVPTTIPVTNILGQTSDEESAGKLVFDLKGETHELTVLGTGDRLFIIIADETGSTETYPGGRYIYVDNPGPGGTTVLDFNKAYNPPCAFSPYTTCQLPPEGNTLPLAVLAGEKLPAHLLNRQLQTIRHPDL
ncbi:MAG: DUF1684 domain-containing protein [Balneolaceae bacterium]|nr:MAG: DUF1684 domain-containing protein [Balneolaceae bacterium]